VVIVVMGVSGTGKTTVGKALAVALEWHFIDADDLHPHANVEKMSRNEPLTDADREPWLAVVHARLANAIHADESLVIACSALKRRYREAIAKDLPVTFVYLAASRAELERRLLQRRGHFATAGLLESQLETLEEPAADEAVIVDAMQPPDALVDAIRAAVGI
jgi:gluconokinase